MLPVLAIGRVEAGTTGGLSGVVLETGAKAPIADARVTVSSPSQVAWTQTGKNGSYHFLSLAPDTYTLSIEKKGYDAVSQSGVTVQTDQSQFLTVTLAKSLLTIENVTARAASSFVRAGVTADVDNISPAQQDAAAPLGGGDHLNSAYSAIARRRAPSFP